MGGSKNVKTARKRNFRTHATGLRHTVKARHAKVGLSAESLAFFDSVIKNSTGSLTRLSAHCMRAAGRETLSVSDVDMAWKMSVPERLQNEVSAAI